MTQYKTQAFLGYANPSNPKQLWRWNMLSPLAVSSGYFTSYYSPAEKLDVNETIIKLDGSSIQYQQWWRVGHFKAEFSGSFAPKPVVAISASVLWVTTANPPTGGEIFKKIQALKYWIMPGFHGISQNLVKNRQARMIRFDFFSNFWHPKTVPSLCGNLLSSHH